MKKPTKVKCEQAIRHLCTNGSTPCRTRSRRHPSWSGFKTWLSLKHYSHYLGFWSTMGADYDGELWFDQEFKHSSRRGAGRRGCACVARRNPIYVLVTFAVSARAACSCLKERRTKLRCVPPFDRTLAAGRAFGGSADMRLDAVLENCIFYIFPMYEFLHMG
jgi:hypothetical protein